MIFWILCGLVVLAAVFGVFSGRADGYIGIVRGLGTLAMSALVGAVIFAGVAITANIIISQDNMAQGHHRSETKLRALSTETSTEGEFHRYFLGAGGSLEGSRQISYIADFGEYSQIDAVEGSRTRIFEDEGSAPYMVTYDYYADMTWLAPWMDDEDFWYDDYEFHVPAGSIQGSDYTLDIHE